MPNRPSTNRLRHVSLLIVLPVAIGCARLHGEPVHRQPIGPDGPRVSVILDDLASNDEAITSFLAKGSCILESPEFAGKKRFRGQVAFRKPGDLSIKGRQRVTNILLFDLTCVDDEFLLDFPADNQRYYRFKGFESPDVEFSVSPLDVVREMLFIEPWAKLPRRRVRLAGYDPSEQAAQLEIRERGRLTRRVTVAGPPWHVVANVLYDDVGQLVAQTTLEEYLDSDGTRFPTLIDVAFPSEETRLTLRLSEFDLNCPLDNRLFEFKWHPRNDDHAY